MPRNYTPEFRKKIIRLHLEEGRSYKSITAEYGVSKASISKWCSEFSKECQNQAVTNPDASTEIELMKENLCLRKELEEAKKENLFLKKSGGILCKGNRLEAYRFIEQNHHIFGLRWLLRHFGIYPNAFYNYRKHRKAAYYAQREKTLSMIVHIYHKHCGVDGYRRMKIYLAREGFVYSMTTIHKYMNSILGLKSIIRPQKPKYERKKAHAIFEDRIQQEFRAEN